MYYRFLVVFLLVIMFLVCCSNSEAQQHRKKPRNHLEDLEEDFERTVGDPIKVKKVRKISRDLPVNVTTSTKLYSKWSRWSRCMHCVQRRIKTCVSPKCQNSKIYEVRHCNKKRCRRKERQKEPFHVVNFNELPLVSHKTCRKSYKEFLISNNMMCAGWVSGRADTCAGDSGGGLMCPVRKTKNAYYTVQGITSFGDGCGRKNKYGIYTTVLNYIDWINYIMDHYS